MWVANGNGSVVVGATVLSACGGKWATHLAELCREEYPTFHIPKIPLETNEKFESALLHPQ